MSGLFAIENTHPDEEYLALRDDSRHTSLKQYFQEAWNKFESFADRNFREELAQQPRRRLWEMYLGVYFLNNNFNLRPHISDGPDLSLIIDNQIVWVEATVPSEGAGPDAVPSPFTQDPNRQGKIPEEKIILRYTNSMSEKLIQYNAHLKMNIVSSKDAFVIAINGMDIRFEQYNADPIPAIAKALYPIEGIQYNIDKQTNEIVNRELTPRYKVSKSSNVEIPTGIFWKPEYSGISGVLYSDADYLTHLSFEIEGS